MAIQQEYEAARKANEQRYAQAMSIYDEIINRYQPGGTFGQAALGQLEAQKTRDIGAETQQLISSGMYGTTTVGGLPRKWEAEVGAPARLRLEDIMMERLSQAQVGKAGFIERREDVYPDVGAYAQYAGQAAQAPQKSLGERWREWQAGISRESKVSPTGSFAGGVAPTPTTAPTRASTTPPPGQREGDRPLEEIMQGVTYEFAGAGTGQQTIKGEDVSGWTDAEKKAYRNYVPGVSGYNVAARKAQQRNK